MITNLIKNTYSKEIQIIEISHLINKVLDQENSNILMGNIMVNTRMDKNMEMESLSGMMDLFIKVIGPKIKLKEWER